MRFYVKPKLIEQLYRPTLYVIMIGGLLVALWPAEQAVSGWQSQRALRAAWNEAEAQQKNHSAKATSAPKSKTVPPHAKVTTPTTAATTAAPLKTTLAQHTSQTKHALSPKHTPHHVARPQTYTRDAGLPPLRLVIPDIGLDAMVVEGVDPTALSQGPGHDPASALPGAPGNCVIAAHRNMYGWWFYHLGKLGSNSIIKLRMPGQTLTYKVAKLAVVHDTNTAILDDPANPNAAPRLTLYTCALPHGSRRIVVVANQVDPAL